jgi:hypothetical protein
MRFSRRHLTAAGAAMVAGSGLLLNMPAFAESSGDEAAVEQAVEALNQAMLDADQPKLEELLADKLSYGHSAGLVDDKAKFIDAVAGKSTIYKAIKPSKQTTSVVGDVAVVRHVLDVDTEAGGKSASSHVGAIQVWHRENGRWRLLARQAFRLPTA